MVATLTLGRPKYAEHAALAEAVAPKAKALAGELLELADADAQAYAACAFALKLPRESFEDTTARDAQIQATAIVAAEVPLRTVERCLEGLRLAEMLSGRSNRNASSDLRVASLLLEAAADGAAANVLVNLPLIGTTDWTTATEARVADLMRDVAAAAKRTRATVEAGDARPPLRASDRAPRVGA